MTHPRMLPERDLSPTMPGSARAYQRIQSVYRTQKYMGETSLKDVPHAALLERIKLNSSAETPRETPEEIKVTLSLESSVHMPQNPCKTLVALHCNCKKQLFPQKLLSIILSFGPLTNQILKGAL